MKDYLFLFKYCKMFISCDAGVWPMAAAMGKNLVFCNVTSCYRTTPNFVYQKGEDDDGEIVYRVKEWIYLESDLAHTPEQDVKKFKAAGERKYDPGKEEYYKDNYPRIYSWMPEKTTKVIKKNWDIFFYTVP